MFSFADAFLLADFLPDRSNLQFFLADDLLQVANLAQQALGLLAQRLLFSFQPLAQGSGLLLLLIQRIQLCLIANFLMGQLEQLVLNR